MTPSESTPSSRERGLKPPKPAEGCENCRELQLWAWSIEDGVIGPSYEQWKHDFLASLLGEPPEEAVQEANRCSYLGNAQYAIRAFLSALMEKP